MGKHAIIVIKKDNKYLQYFEETWNSYLFPNCKIENEYDKEITENKVKELLNTKILNIDYIDKRTHNKFSESAKKEKEYTHYFFKVEVENIELNENLKLYSYEELTKDERIMKVNSDIVSYIKELNL